MNRYLLHSLIFIFITLNSFGVFSQEKKSKLPPKIEDTYLFEIFTYDRQPAIPAYMREGIERMVAKPMPKWDAQDSLFFAFENVHLKRFEKAYNSFARLNTDTLQEKHAQILYRTALYKYKKFDKLLAFNEATFQENKQRLYSFKTAFKDFVTASENHKQDPSYYDDKLIFPILKDDTLIYYAKDESPQFNKYVEVAFAIDSVFRQFSILHDENDFLLSKAFEEMGDFQRKNFYTTNAFFYYSAALHYNKNSKSVIEKYNSTNHEINAKNLIKISFKNKFGMVIKNRYKLSKDYIQKTSIDEGPENFYPPTVVERKDYLPWLDFWIIVMLIITGALVYVIFFLKSEE